MDLGNEWLVAVGYELEELGVYISDLLSTMKQRPTRSIPDLLEVNCFCSTAATCWKKYEQHLSDLPHRCHELFAPLVLNPFQKLFVPLIWKPCILELPAAYDSWERAIAHNVAAELGLNHQSYGEGKERRLVISSHSSLSSMIVPATWVLPSMVSFRITLLPAVLVIAARCIYWQIMKRR